jgi:hypothetical protein
LSSLKLVVSRSEAREKLNRRIETGTELCERHLDSAAKLEQARSEYYTWNDYNEHLLTQLFSSTSDSRQCSMSRLIAP